MNASIGEFPWIVSLQLKDRSSTTYKHFCGSGTIVEATHVITAAHCVWNKSPETIQVLAGAIDLAVEEPSQQRVDVLSIFLHPNYTA